MLTIAHFFKLLYQPKSHKKDGGITSWRKAISIIEISKFKYDEQDNIIGKRNYQERLDIINANLTEEDSKEVEDLLSSKSLKISARYVPKFDKYTANIFYSDSYEFQLSAENGSDLAELVQMETGVLIEYNKSNRQFVIPKENKF